MPRFATWRSLGLTALLVVGLVAACDSDDADHADDGGSGGGAASEPAWPDSDVTVGPLVSGASSTIDGTFAWTDYVYDDLGPNSDDGDLTDMDSAGGDATYPDGLTNAADFVQTQFTDGDDGLSIRVVLETLVDPAVPLVGVAFDTDDDTSTGAATLPGTWEPDGSLGVEFLVVLADGAGEVLEWDGTDWSNAVDLDVTVDPEENTLEATVPSSVVSSDGATWRILGVAGTTTASWLSGDGEIHDLAFVGDEPFYQWQDYRQADILAGKAPVDDAFVTVDVSGLADGSTELPDATAPGFHTYLYHSDLNLPEGVVETDDGPEFLGPFQPYLVYVPDGGHEAGGAMTMFLHGLTQNHLGSVILGDLYLGTGRVLSEEIGGLAEFVRDGTDFPPYNLTVWPLARGAGLFYEGIAEADVLDVLDDAAMRLEPDPDRVILSGASMGGIGTFRLGALYPDLWSIAVPIIGFARGPVEPLLTNYENLEIRQINGVVDTLIAMPLAEGTTDLLDELGLRFRAWMFDDRGHEAGGYAWDCVYRDLGDHVREQNPARVRYTVDPAQFVVDPDIGLDLVHDRAYWVSGIEVADDSSLGSVDAHSGAIAQRAIDEILHIDERGESDESDVCGPNPDVSTGDTWRYRAVEWIFGDELTPERLLEVELTNLAGVTLDLARAGLGGGGASTLSITTDVEVEVTLTGLEFGQEVTVDGTTVAADADGTTTVTAPAGSSTIEVAAAG